MKDLHDLANLIGYEAIDNEFLSWLEIDSNLREEALGVLRKREPQAFATDRMKYLANSGDEMKQAIHRLIHSNGPYGWEFCGYCK